MKTSMNKNAVSPLIATVLLIAFAVALGAVVMNWSKTQINGEEGGLETGPCANIEFGIEQIGESPNVCYSNDGVTALVKNDGSQTINKLKATVISNTGDPYNVDIEVSIPSFETKKVNFEIPDGFGDVQKVKLIPLVFSDLKNPSKEEICSTQLVEILHPRKC